MDFLKREEMEDATKALAKLLYGAEPETDASDNTFEAPESSAAQAQPGQSESAPGTPEAPQETTKEKAQDRWFREQRGNKRVPKRQSIPNEALVTSGGPIKVTGNITLIEEDGTVSHATELSLCRCGASRSKPLCDEEHIEMEFFDSGNISKASDWSKTNRPQTITIKMIPDGPLQFSGYLRVYNCKGQESISMRGQLCRCGRSSKKPFCDCQ
jgi:CDGSH-type Zn-finger protein